jgi:hypothetical protein
MLLGNHLRPNHKLEEIQVAGKGGLKEFKQSPDKKWTAFEQIFAQAGNRFR